MSTKTTFKRIALVTVVALGFGGLTGVAAHAASDTATGALNVTQAYYGVGANFTSSGKSTSGSQLVGGTAIVGLQIVNTHAIGNTNTQTNVTSTGVGAISFASQDGMTAGTNANAVVIAPQGATAGTVSWPTSSITVNSNPNTETDTVSIAVSSSVAGTQTLTVQILNSSGTPSSTLTYTATITWVASGAGVGMTAANSTMYISTATCTYGAATGGKAGDTAAAAANSGATSSVAASTSVNICISTRDNNNVLIPATVNALYSSLGGTVSAGTDTTGNISATTLAYNVKGKATVTAILTDGYSNVITLTAPLTYYGTLATLTLANATYAAAKGGVVATNGPGVFASLATGAAGDIGTPTSGQGGLILMGKDSDGNLIDLSTQGNSTGSFTIDSDANAGAPAAKASDSAGATVLFDGTTTASADLKATHLGGNGVLVSCVGSTKAEKLTITAFGKDKNAATVTSNSVTFYCSTSAKAVAVTATSSSVDAGGTTTVTALASDLQGYPVADGTSVTFAATGAGAIAPATSTTVKGVAGTTDSNLVNFIANGDGGSATVTAIAGNYSGSTSISVAGGSGAASLSLDAANAATDAANNAYDEAQNATQAASDALAAVTALSAQVSALIATVKSLAAMVAKIKAKVKA